MGILKAMGGSWPLPEHVEKVVDRARSAWSDGRPTFVWRQIATSGLNEDGINDALDKILGVGWSLHTVTTHFNTVGLNAEVGLFIFTRPE